MSQPNIDPITLKRFAHYAEITGMPLDQVVTEALDEWMDTIGEVVLAEFIRRSRTRRRQNANTAKKDVAKPTSYDKVMDIGSSRQFRTNTNNAPSTTTGHYLSTRTAV